MVCVKQSSAFNITELMLMKHSYTAVLTPGSIIVIASVRAGADASVNAC